MTAANNEYYRFCLTFPNEERRAMGTLWLVDNRKLAFIGDMDHVQGTAEPMMLLLDTDQIDETSVRKAFLDFNPTYHLIGLKKWVFPQICGQHSCLIGEIAA